MSTWYYADAEHQRHGPVDGVELVHLFEQNRLQRTSLVWRDGMTQWQALGEVAAELGIAAPAAGAAQTAFAAAAADTAGASPYAPPAAPLLRASQVHLGADIVYAGFWKRVAAYMIDGFIIGIAGGIVGAMIGGVLGVMMASTVTPGSSSLLIIQVITQVIGLLMGATYFGWMHSSGQQATLGKMAIGIKVVRGNGERITFLRGFGRYFAFLLTGFTLFVGYVMAAFTDRKRALHDMISDTVVVDKWAHTEHPEWQKRELGTVTVVVLIASAVLIVAAVALVGVGIAALAGLH